jgi:hypothetical protein
MIIDDREGRSVEYLAMPIEVIKDGDIRIPEIDHEEAQGFDGVTRDYISVKWQEIKPGMIMKKYDVVGHIVSAGCELSEASKEDGILACDNKSIFTVLHPAEEWMEKHVIELKKTSNN